MNVAVAKAVKLSILSLPAHLPIVRAAAEKVCQMVGFDELQIGKIVLSIDEALTNVIKHAYGQTEDKPIDVELIPTSKPVGLRICVRDYADGVDVTEIRARNVGQMRPGGFGVRIMNECMDSVEYALAPGGGTVLTMIKSITGDDGGVG